MANATTGTGGRVEASYCPGLVSARWRAAARSGRWWTRLLPDRDAQGRMFALWQKTLSGS
ncbi:MAG: hypothetical protein JNM64_15070 [Chloroflexia bacterium]|nr:hypothetical protein [Chloroflexia bacterium]